MSYLINTDFLIPKNETWWLFIWKLFLSIWFKLYSKASIRIFLMFSSLQCLYFFKIDHCLRHDFNTGDKTWKRSWVLPEGRSRLQNKSVRTGAYFIASMALEPAICWQFFLWQLSLLFTSFSSGRHLELSNIPVLGAVRVSPCWILRIYLLDWHAYLPSGETQRCSQVN